MGKGRGGHFSGTKGRGNIGSVMKNVKLSISKLRGNPLRETPKVFSGKSASDIANELKSEGYDVLVRNSTRSRSLAKITQVNNSGNGKNISQVQISPGGGRHGSDPYVKISTTDKGIVKVVEGSKNTYKTDGKEKATIIFTEEE